MAKYEIHWCEITPNTIFGKNRRVSIVIQQSIWGKPFVRLDNIVCTLLASLRSNSGWQKWIELPGTCVLVVSCFLYVYLTYHWPCKVIWGHLIISPVTFNKIDWVLFSSLEQNSIRAFLVLSPASTVCPFFSLLTFYILKCI